MLGTVLRHLCLSRGVCLERSGLRLTTFFFLPNSLEAECMYRHVCFTAATRSHLLSFLGIQFCSFLSVSHYVLLVED